MYLTSGHPVQWSRDTFLPGKLDLHVVRELFEVQEPAVEGYRYQVSDFLVETVPILETNH